MTERLSITEELVAAVDAAPGPFGTATQHAAYQRRIAAVLRRIAADGDNPATAQVASDEADRADQRAVVMDGIAVQTTGEAGT